AKQWHVHLWDTGEGNGVEFFSHYEYRPEPYGPIDFNRPFEHYWPDYGETYIQGQHSEGVKELLEEGGEYEGEDGKVGSKEVGEITKSFRDVLRRIG
ncbi:MAG: hypothetical protein SXQ77_08090, partial [Halobacteria archaeon]|nr:hypothetical protein [Halobacteria archaeon]